MNLISQLAECHGGSYCSCDLCNYGHMFPHLSHVAICLSEVNTKYRRMFAGARNVSIYINGTSLQKKVFSGVVVT